ncbi:lipoyl(octanoyl) transferase LipB [Leucobacter coleopterorum]|uniref:lipoyl(octanoyl) transferase LipB n=1 Tax=Leucobacter coleopterorum TaxID=2714933 RepID=UPI001FCAAFF9|nr:lipoyl(octanoyl) transferase LipB [Leucobacter coleopterorum]
MTSELTTTSPLGAPHVSRAAINLMCAGFSPSFVPYERGLELQEGAVAKLSSPTPDGTLIVLEHEAVYTAGRRSRPEEFPTDGTPVVPVDRGGKVTWHGPGQLVAYPVVRLRNRFALVDFVRVLEQVIIDVAGGFGVEGVIIDGRTGVWARPAGLPAEKFAQIGIRVSEGIVTHGLAINCSNSLAPFKSFVPCGITDAGVTTLSRLAGRTIAPNEVAPTLAVRLTAALTEVTQ